MFKTNLFYYKTTNKTTITLNFRLNIKNINIFVIFQ